MLYWEKIAVRRPLGDRRTRQEEEEARAASLYSSARIARAVDKTTSTTAVLVLTVQSDFHPAVLRPVCSKTAVFREKQTGRQFGSVGTAVSE